MRHNPRHFGEDLVADDIGVTDCIGVLRQLLRLLAREVAVNVGREEGLAFVEYFRLRDVCVPAIKDLIERSPTLGAGTEEA